MHLAVLGSGCVFADVLSGNDWAHTAGTSPSLQLLLALSARVAIPFFALAATAPLVQRWYADLYPKQTPYLLYAVSNGGSLLGLLAYPFVLEPYMTLSLQGRLWFYGYLLFAGACACCAILAIPLGSPPHAGGSREQRDREAGVKGEGGTRHWAWFLFSMLGSVLLLSTTERVSQEIAASPLFWVIPFSLYLVSFILCFAHERLYSRAFWLRALPVAVATMAAQVLFGGDWHGVVQLSLFSAILFVGCMVCHGELFRARPAAADLTRYYLIVSAGGAVGGMVVALVAPLLFPRMWEYPIAWLGLLSLVWVRRLKEARVALQQRETPASLRGLTLGWLAAAAVLFVDLSVDYRGAQTVHRNFFGTYGISEEGDRRCLYHGATQHGCQWTDPVREMAPTTYFGPRSGVAAAIEAMRVIHRESGRTGMQIGVIGLGVGTIAAWGEGGDILRFYEIDPDVADMARERFRFLTGTSAKVDIVIGDGRLGLAKRSEGKAKPPLFDVLVVDAFSGDAVPLHLMTREAFAVYAQNLAPEGIFAMHVSNRHFALEPLVLGLAKESHKEALLVRTQTHPETLVYKSSWVLVTGNPRAAKAVREGGYAAPWPRELAKPVVFTDQYSNLLSLVKGR